MTYDELVELFGARGGKALCPVHDDHKPSLSVSKGDGKTLLKCHAGQGCTIEAICTAKNIGISDLYDEPRRNGNGKSDVTARYRYTDETGVLLFEVLRFFPKDFRQVPANGRRGPGAMNGTPLVLYRLPQVVAAVGRGSTVLITEGERDADRAVAEGYCATTAPMGAGKWNKVADHARQILTGADVIVVADRDQPGYAHARDIAASIGPVAKSLVVVEALTGKDLTDHLAAGHTVEDLVEVDPVLLADEPSAPGERTDLSGVTDQWPRLTVKTLPNPFVIPSIDWHARGLLCRPTHGELAGGEKTLKSYLGTVIDVGLGAGLPILGRFHVDRAQKVLAFPGEGGEAGHLRRVGRICHAYGISPRDLDGRYRYVVDTAPVTSLTFRGTLADELDSFQPDLVHPDPWYAFAPTEVDARNLYEQGRALNDVGALVASGGATLLFNNHFNQTGNGGGLQRISMAGHAEWCDSWLLVSHRTAPDVAAGRFRLKMVVGSRQWGGAEYHVDFDIGRWDDELNDHVGALRWNVTVATDENAPDPLEAKIADFEARLIQTWRRRRGSKTPWTQGEWFDRTTGANTDLRVAWLRLVDLGRIVEVQIGLVDSAGRTQPSDRFALVESPLETGET